MKVAFLLPGYLDSPDYLHLVTFEKRLKELGYMVERLHPCNLWKTGNGSDYSITNYIEQLKERIEFYKIQNSEEILLIGHSLGGFISILAGNLITEVTRISALCAPSSIENLGKKWENKPSRVSKRDLPDMADTSVSPKETETLVSKAIHPYVVRMQNVGHNFRHSREECNLVMNEIEKFLEK